MTRSCRVFVRGTRFYAEKNYKKAFELFLMSAKRGYAFAQYMVGEMLVMGKEVDENEEEGIKWLKKAAKNGSTQADCLLGKVYLYGWGLKKDKKEGLKYLMLAAEEGNSEAEYHLGRAYFDEGPEIPRDYDECEYWLKKVAENGHVNAQNDLAVVYTMQRSGKLDYKKALKWFMVAASNGDIESQNAVSRYYYDGLGVEKNEQEAIKWVRSHEQRKLELVYEDKEKIDRGLNASDWHSIRKREQEAVRRILN